MYETTIYLSLHVACISRGHGSRKTGVNERPV